VSAAEVSRLSCARASLSPATRRADGYARRRPEETLLYRVVREHWPSFRDNAGEQGGLPRFVVRELDDYLGCGLPERGLVHLACSRCGQSIVVAFSCKRRGFCPSCCGRRSADVAAHMVDEVFPEVPIRQWVCSFPWSLRTPLGYDRALSAAAMGSFARALEHSMRWRAKKLLALSSVDDALFGAVTFVQRSDSALRLAPHAHTLALDGVYVKDAGALVFHALPPPSVADVYDVALRTHARLAKVLAAHGRSLDAPAEAALDEDEAVLASCYAASAADVELLGARAGQRTTKLVRALREVPAVTAARACADVHGVNVHAEVALDGRDRARLERLVRYVTRPPLATDRLEEHPGGRVRYGFKKAWKDGTQQSCWSRSTSLRDSVRSSRRRGGTSSVTTACSPRTRPSAPSSCPRRRSSRRRAASSSRYLSRCRPASAECRPTRHRTRPTSPAPPSRRVTRGRGS
jgi:hypothetical protein